MADEIDYGRLPVHLRKLVDLLPLNEKVHRSVLEEAYGRSNYARRIRKIIKEYGWDIERFRGTSGANDDYYIRRSNMAVRDELIRREVAPRIREGIYERDGYICCMCGVDVSLMQSLTKAQCDHKQPAERGGSSKASNLQTLCTICNLKKRQACMGCRLPTCDGCPYAYPEQFADVFPLRLTPDLSRKLTRLALREKAPALAIIMRLIADAR